MGRVADFFREQSIPLAQQQRTKMVSLDRQFEEMEAERNALKAENLHLKAKVNPLEREVERLKNQIQQKGAPVHSLEPSEIEMLKFVGDRKGNILKDIAEGMNLHSVAAEHFLERLVKAGYLDQSQVPMVGAWHALTAKGNAYLVSNKLVPVPAAQAEQPSNPKGHHCDHCGGVQLRRTGSRPDPTFSGVGIKQALYKCLSCGKESAFTNDES